jgi:hypothetical protein
MKLCLHCLVRIDGVVLDLARGLLSLYGMFLNSMLILMVLGAFAKFLKTTMSLRLSICSSVCPHGTVRLPLDGFSRNLVFEYFSKICRKNSSTLHEDQWTFLITSRSILLRMRLVSCKCCRENQITHFSSITFFRKSYRLWDNV